MDKKGGYQDFPSIVFCIPQCRKLWQGNPSVLFFRKLPVAKKTLVKSRRGVSRFSVEGFFVPEWRKFS